jgi:site-specific recombinase XerD
MPSISPEGQASLVVCERYLRDLEDLAEVVFSSERTMQVLSERAVGYLIAKYATLAHIPQFHPHDLRHRFGYHTAEAVPLHRFAQIMGMTP